MISPMVLMPEEPYTLASDFSGGLKVFYDSASKL